MLSLLFCLLTLIFFRFQHSQIKNEHPDRYYEGNSTGNKAFWHITESYFVFALWYMDTDKSVLEGFCLDFFTIDLGRPAFIIWNSRDQCLGFIAVYSSFSTVFADFHVYTVIFNLVYC